MTSNLVRAELYVENCRKYDYQLEELLEVVQFQRQAQGAAVLKLSTRLRKSLSPTNILYAYGAQMMVNAAQMRTSLTVLCCCTVENGTKEHLMNEIFCILSTEMVSCQSAMGLSFQVCSF